MSLEEIYKRIEEQMKAKRELEAAKGPRRKLPDRRLEAKPVENDQRLADRRQGIDRRMPRRVAPQRLNYPNNEAYNKAYDRWAENQ